MSDRVVLVVNDLAAAVSSMGSTLAETASLLSSLRSEMQGLRSEMHTTTGRAAETASHDDGHGVPASAPDGAFVSVTLPSGATYELSIASSNPDVYHDAVASAAAYEPNWHFLNAWLRPGDVFFDLGANIGTISIPAAVNGAVVHAFELLDANVQHLVRSVQRNSLSNVSIVVGAVSDTSGLLGIGGVSAWGTIVPGALVSIPSVVIDTYVAQRAIGAVSVMKVDVEGSEKAALLGAVALIERDHPDILIECNALTCGNNSYSYRDLLRFLTEHGYTLYRLHQDRLCPWSADMVQEIIYTDYFATTKPAAEITAKSGWSISALVTQDVIANIEEQDRHGSLHQQFILAIEPTLPASVRCDQRVAPLLKRWANAADARDQHVLSILETGSA